MKINQDDALDDRLRRIEHFFMDLQDQELRNRIISGIKDVRDLDSGIHKFQFVSFLEKYINGLDI